MISREIIVDAGRLVARIFVSLLSGFIIRVGTRVFAIRDANAVIDDGINCVETRSAGLFERFNIQVGVNLIHDRHHWAFASEGAIRSTLRTSVKELDQIAFEMLEVDLIATSALSPELYRTALNTGTLLTELPTAIIRSNVS